MNSRLETFCDGVFAIAITLLILDIKVPPLATVHSVSDVWRAIAYLWPSFFALILSFTIIFISWTGHHNLLRVIDKSSSYFIFANGFFMFTIIFIPFPTAFMAEYLNTQYAQPAILFYCLNSVFHNIGWNALHRSVLKPSSLFKDSVDQDFIRRWAKSAKIGFLVNVVIALIAVFFPYAALVISVSIYCYWLYTAISINTASIQK